MILPIEGGMTTFSRELWVGVGIAVALWPMLGRGRTLFRHEVALMFIGWSGYTWWIL